MTRLIGLMLSLSLLLAVGGTGIAAAQEKSGAIPPPKLLTITREYTKPGKAGSAHEKTESLFVQAIRNAKWPTHYLAVESLSGKSRALFLTGYDSFAEWEKDYLASQKNAALSAALDSAWAKDGELLSDVDGGTFQFREEYSLRPNVDIAHMRYFEIGRFVIRPGHEKDWDDIMKLVLGAYEKIPDAHWATYAEIYGTTNSTYIYFIPMKSGEEMDRGLAEGKEFEAAMGGDGMKRLGELSAAAIEENQTNLFAFNPRMSYPRDEWIKADPDFWKPKAAGAPAGKKKAEPSAGQ
jgi:hypothetical protein